MHALEIRSDQKNHLGCGAGGVLINERRGSGCGVYPCCSSGKVGAYDGYINAGCSGPNIIVLHYHTCYYY